MDGVLSADPSRQTTEVPEETTLQWVLGFRSDPRRTHQPARLGRSARCRPRGAHREGHRVRDARLTSGPLGAARHLVGPARRRRHGRPVHPRRADLGALFRFEASVPAKATEAVDLPTTLSVLEQPLADDPRSALGEWGLVGRDGPYEWARAARSGLSGGHDRRRRHVRCGCAAGRWGRDHGRVHRGEDVDWYAMQRARRGQQRHAHGRRRAHGRGRAPPRGCRGRRGRDHLRARSGPGDDRVPRQRPGRGDVSGRGPPAAPVGDRGLRHEHQPRQLPAPRDPVHPFLRVGRGEGPGGHELPALRPEAIARRLDRRSIRPARRRRQLPGRREPRARRRPPSSTPAGCCRPARAPAPSCS